MVDIRVLSRVGSLSTRARPYLSLALRREYTCLSVESEEYGSNIPHGSINLCYKLCGVCRLRVLVIRLSRRMMIAADQGDSWTGPIA